MATPARQRKMKGSERLLQQARWCAALFTLEARRGIEYTGGSCLRARRVCAARAYARAAQHDIVFRYVERDRRYMRCYAGGARDEVVRHMRAPLSAIFADAAITPRHACLFTDIT